MQTTINDEEKPLLVSNGHLSHDSSQTYESINPAFDGENIVVETKPDKPDFSLRKSGKRQIIVFFMIGFVNFCACTCFSLIAPFFPAEAAHKDTSQTVVGLIFSCFELGIFITSPIFGYFLTRIGAKFMFTSGVMVCGCTSVLFGILDKCPPGQTFIIMCFVCRTVEAFGCSAFITASFAIIAHEFPDNVATVFGTLETFSGIGLMIGPPIGGALYQLGGYGLPFWILGAVLLVCGFTSFWLMPGQDEAPKPLKGNLLTLLRSPLVFVGCLTIFCGSFSLGFLDPTLANHLKIFNLGAFYIGLVFLCAPGMYGLTAPFFGYLGDSKGYLGSMMLFGLVASSITFLLLGPAPFLEFIPNELWINIVVLCFFGLFVGLALIPTFKTILIGAKQLGFDESLDTYGMVSGLFNSSFSLGAFVGPSLGGVLQDHYGFGWASSACAFVYMFASVIVLIFICTSKQGFREPS